MFYRNVYITAESTQDEKVVGPNQIRLDATYVVIYKKESVNLHPQTEDGSNYNKIPSVTNGPPLSSILNLSCQKMFEKTTGLPLSNAACEVQFIYECNCILIGCGC